MYCRRVPKEESAMVYCRFLFVFFKKSALGSLCSFKKLFGHEFSVSGSFGYEPGLDVGGSFDNVDLLGLDVLGDQDGMSGVSLCRNGLIFVENGEYCLYYLIVFIEYCSIMFIVQNNLQT